MTQATILPFNAPAPMAVERKESSAADHFRASEAFCRQAALTAKSQFHAATLRHHAAECAKISKMMEIDR